MRRFLILAAGLAMAGCGRTPPAMTLGEVPRDGRGLPVWPIVARKASRPDLIPAAYRPDPAAGRQDRRSSGKQS